MSDQFIHARQLSPVRPHRSVASGSAPTTVADEMVKRKFIMCTGRTGLKERQNGKYGPAYEHEGSNKEPICYQSSKQTKMLHKKTPLSFKGLKQLCSCAAYFDKEV
jgi:hypothetical protein